MTYPTDTLTRAQGGKFASNGGTVRDAKIMAAAIDLAERLGLEHVTRANIAQVAGVSVGSVSNYGCERPTASPESRRGVVGRIRQALMRKAVADGLVRIVAQGIVAGDPIALAAPDELKARALVGALHGGE